MQNLLVEAVQKCCDNKVKHAEELANTHGWPIGKLDVSQVTDFSHVFAHGQHFDKDISKMLW